jgi:hypothetical protein
VWPPTRSRAGNPRGYRLHGERWILRSSAEHLRTAQDLPGKAPPMTQKTSFITNWPYRLLPVRSCAVLARGATAPFRGWGVADGRRRPPSWAARKYCLRQARCSRGGPRSGAIVGPGLGHHCQALDVAAAPGRFQTANGARTAKPEMVPLASRAPAPADGPAVAPGGSRPGTGGRHGGRP